MIYIDISKLKPENSWLEKSQKLLSLMTAETNLQKRNEIIEKNHKIWKELKGELKKISYGKCWYSEAREIFSHYHVDHFRPKIKAIDDVTGERIEREGYWWLAFEWTNYRLSGSVGNTKKSEHFAVKSNISTCPEENYNDEVIYFLDPTKPNDYKKLIFNEDGSVNPSNPNETLWDHIKAKYTIDKLHLDFPDLAEARRIKWKKINTLIEEVDLINIEYQNNPSAKIEERLEVKIESVRELLAPCEELLSTVRACLRASRKDWAIALLEENIDNTKYCSDYIIPIEIENGDNE